LPETLDASPKEVKAFFVLRAESLLSIKISLPAAFARFACLAVSGYFRADASAD
jgi:hypothetical protein